MRSKVQETVSRFIEELRAQHPGVTVQLLDWESPYVDAWLRLRCSSEEELDAVTETEARLTTDYYIDEGVYIQVAESYYEPTVSAKKEST